MTKLLDPSDYLTQIASGLKSDLDIELLLGFVLCVRSCPKRPISPC